jgi:hypothetical protein
MTPSDTLPAEIRKALELLELPPKATAAEVHQAYRFLKDLYSGESIATLPISSEMSETERREILRGIEEAYKTLIQFFDAEREKKQGGFSALPADLQQYLTGVEEIDGSVLKTVREMHGYGLKEVAAETRIPAEQLNNIETEAFGDLPPAVYTRGFVVGYAAFLEVDADRAARDIMARFDRWRREKGSRPSRKRFRLAFWRRKQ